MRILLLLGLMGSIALAQSTPSNGDTLFSKGDWAGAAQEFQRLTEANPQDGRSFFRLGSALHHLGKFGEAASAFESAAKLKFQAPYAIAAAARSYAASGDTTKALDLLRQSAASGFAQLNFVDNDSSFATLKSNPIFAAARERIRINAKPCTTEPEYKQLDFWVGDWDVVVQGQTIGRNHIEKISDGCIVQENWMPLNGLNGKSWNFYNAGTKKWEQTWIGPGGGVIKLEGEAGDGKMLFRGTSYMPNGSRALTRVTLTRNGDGLHQLLESSTDDGKTWTVGFDGAYRRANTGPEHAISADERRELLEHLKTSRRIFHEALRGVSVEQAKFKPASDRWSILECAEHIAQAEKLLFADALAGLDQPPDGAKSRVTKESLLEAWGTANVKVKSSGDYDPIGRWTDLASIEKVFDERRERSINFISETERDLRGRICCGDLDIWQQILAMSAHTLRHVKQIEAVKADPGYPG